MQSICSLIMKHTTAVIINLEAQLDSEANKGKDVIMLAEVEKAIDKLKDWKSRGVDGISTELI